MLDNIKKEMEKTTIPLTHSKVHLPSMFSFMETCKNYFKFVWDSDTSKPE